MKLPLGLCVELLVQTKMCQYSWMSQGVSQVPKEMNASDSQSCFLNFHKFYAVFYWGFYFEILYDHLCLCNNIIYADVSDKLILSNQKGGLCRKIIDIHQILYQVKVLFSLGPPQPGCYKANKTGNRHIQPVTALLCKATLCPSHSISFS